MCRPAVGGLVIVLTVRRSILSVKIGLQARR